MGGRSDLVSLASFPKPKPAVEKRKAVESEDDDVEDEDDNVFQKAPPQKHKCLFLVERFSK